MSADLHTLLDTDPAAGLRGVAALMRERAEAATPGPWVAHHRRGGLDWPSSSPHVESTDHESGSMIDERWGSLWPHRNAVADATHIAAADPPFVLAVADWLDAFAGRIEEIHDSLPFAVRLTLDSLSVTAPHQAIATARAYLGQP